MSEDGKVCTGKCKKFKPFSEFHKDRTQKDGYKKLCKDCRSEVQAEQRKSKTEGVNDEDRLNSEARVLAIHQLIEMHRKEYLIYLRRAKDKLGVKSKWIQVN